MNLKALFQLIQAICLFGFSIYFFSYNEPSLVLICVGGGVWKTADFLTKL